MKFPESKLAHEYLDGLKGIEIGGSAHNHFNIKDCINVDWTDDLTTSFKLAEIDLCGECLPVDVVAEGDKLPFPNDTWDYVINSHVIEHLPDTIGALIEWARVVKPGGLLYLVIPIRDENPDDARHPYTTLEHFAADFFAGEDIYTHPYPDGFGLRGHLHFYNIDLFLKLISTYFPKVFQVVETLKKDDRVGNGFTVVLRVVDKSPIKKFFRNV